MSFNFPVSHSCSMQTVCYKQELPFSRLISPFFSINERMFNENSLSETINLYLELIEVNQQLMVSFDEKQLKPQMETAIERGYKAISFISNLQIPFPNILIINRLCLEVLALGTFDDLGMKL